MPSVTAADDRIARPTRPGIPWGVLMAMPLYSLLAFSRLDERTGLAGAMAAVVLVYPLVIYIFYGVTRMVYEHQYLPLTIGSTVAIATALVVSRFGALGQVIPSWGMVLGAGGILGYLSRRAHALGRGYLIGLVVVALLGVVQWLSVWQQAIQAAPETVESIAPSFEEALKAVKVPAAQVATEIDQFKRVTMFIIRMSPATILLNLFVQFSLGTLLFSRWLSRSTSTWNPTPFMYWQVPFAVTPLLVLTIVLRLTGQDTLTLIADNTLLILSVFYCLTGLSVCEFYLAKFGLTRWKKVAFYVLLVLSQFLGYIATAVIGFVDSFLDWRKVRLRKITG